MPSLDANRARRQERVETAIGVLAPLLDLVIAVGDRVSRALERDDPDHPPARMAPEGESAPRGLRNQPRRSPTRG